MDEAETLHAGHRWSDADDTADAVAAAAVAAADAAAAAEHTCLLAAGDVMQL